MTLNTHTEINQDNYRSFHAVANSDLSWLEKKMMPKEWVIDSEQAFKMGSLIDAMITEAHKVDYYTHRLEDVQYTAKDFELAKKMKQSFRNPNAYMHSETTIEAAKRHHAFVMDLIQDCSFQHISYQPAFEIQHDGVTFRIPAKAKWDLKHKVLKLGGDIKSTTATTMAGCMAALKHFNYDRSRAWYMDLEGHDMDCLIFISKVNFKVFVIPFDRKHWIYTEGKAKYQELAFKYWTMYM